MDKQLFEREFNRAKRMASIENNEYWSGYQRGLRRRFHGENFGTDKEHELWVSMVNSRDERRRRLGKGYKAGYDAYPEA